MWVPNKELKKKQKQNKRKTNVMERTDAERDSAEEKKNLFFFSSLYFFLRFLSFCPSDFVGINTESALRDEGYA